MTLTYLYSILVLPNKHLSLSALAVYQTASKLSGLKQHSFCPHHCVVREFEQGKALTHGVTWGSSLGLPSTEQGSEGLYFSLSSCNTVKWLPQSLKQTQTYANPSWALYLHQLSSVFGKKNML